MSYRQFKKYIKQILPSWEYSEILTYKEQGKEEAKKLKSKRQLERKLEEN